MKKLEGKVALVTGAGRGIGWAIAKKLASGGASVVVNDFDEAPALATVAEIQSSGAAAAACIGDVTSAEFAEAFVATALSKFGGLDIIVNNAGFIMPQAIHKMSEEQFRRMLDVHLTGPFLLLRAAAGPLRELVRAEEQAGREVFRKVVNISSIAATAGIPMSVNYASAKAGVIGLTRALAKEWGRYHVNVNCVAFGLIETRLTDPDVALQPTLEIAGQPVNIGTMGSKREAMAKAIPLGRAGTVEEAAGAVYLFCLPESDYITGQLLTVAGGWTG